VACHARWPKGWLGLSLAAQSGREAARGAETTRVCRARSQRGNHAQLTRVTVQCCARWRQAATGELTGATGMALGNAVGGGAQPSGGAAWRRWRMLRAVAFIGGEGASVAGGDGGRTLQCGCGRGKVSATSNGDNGGGSEGLTVKRRRRWRLDRNRRGVGVSDGGSR
jgi:hypothetical protein